MELIHAGQETKEILQRPHAAQRLELVEEIVEVELRGAQPLLQAGGVVEVDVLGRFLDEADHVAHAQDAPGEAVGMEHLERLDFFARAGELHRPPGHLAQRKRRAAARVAVELGEDEPGDPDRAVEFLRHAHRLLPGRRVAHEQAFVRPDNFFHPPQLVDEALVEVLPPGRVVNFHVAALRLGPRHPVAHRAQDVFLSGLGPENRHVDLRGKGRELLDGGGALQVARDQHRRASALFEERGQLRAGGRLARAVEPHHEDARLRAERQRLGVAAEQRRQLVVENFDDLLTGRDAAQHFLAERLLLDPRDEVFRHAEMHVRLEQGEAHFAQRVVDVRLADAPVPAESLEDVLQLVGESEKHRWPGRLAQAGGPQSSSPRSRKTLSTWRKWRSRPQASSSSGALSAAAISGSAERLARNSPSPAQVLSAARCTAS